MAKAEKVTISIDVKLPGQDEFRHAKITVDMVSVAGRAAVEIEQNGDSPEANAFTINWLNAVLQTFQHKKDTDKVPEKPH